ncbi:MAG: hypothetical protein K2X45_15395, partial [Phreatobacter sp.]|nr:hypothetical protein [Phreatobacter sp.]
TGELVTEAAEAAEANTKDVVDFVADKAGDAARLGKTVIDQVVETGEAAVTTGKAVLEKTGEAIVDGARSAANGAAKVVDDARQGLEDGVGIAADIGAGLAGGLGKAGETAVKAGAEIIDAFREGFADNAKIDDSLSVVSTGRSSGEQALVAEKGEKGNSFLGSFFDDAKEAVEEATKAAGKGSQESSDPRFILVGNDQAGGKVADIGKARGSEVEKPLFELKEELPKEIFDKQPKGPSFDDFDDFAVAAKPAANSFGKGAPVQDAPPPATFGGFDKDFGDDAPKISFNLF